MALLAEELVEEWLRRQGFFAIRGARMGVHEIDLLAVKLMPDEVVCRHIEVQASVNPQNYISHLTKDHRKLTGKAASSRVTRDEGTLAACVIKWVEKKFGVQRKRELMAALVPTSLNASQWTRELVVNKYKYQREVDLIREQGIQIHALGQIVLELHGAKTVIESAAGGDFVNLVKLGYYSSDNT